MNQIKRLLNVNQSINLEMKKFRIAIEEEKSMTCIENLSNELLYEIFDYLDGCDIFDAFSNLNARFQGFLNSSLFLLKIYRFSTRERTFKRYCKQVIIPNKSKIISLNLYDQALINLFCTLCNIDLSFNRLESLVLNGIKLDQLLPLLIDSINLPRLVSLNIRIIGDCEDLDHVYQLILNLPSLKYIKFSPVIDKRIDLLPIATHNRISTIEHLNIDHGCIFDELNAILSYTPQLRRLTCKRLFNSENLFTSRLFNLTYISINDSDFNFDEFEIFIKKICSKLQVMRFINRSNDTAYLDADRWERLILQYIPDLSTFNFQFFENLSTPHSFNSYHTRMNQFTTKFWIERQWIFELEINFGQIIYSIHPYRKRWCDLKSDTKNSCQAIQLTVTKYYNINHQIIIDKIKSISSWIQITYLDINCNMISIMTVVNIIRHLPYIDSIRIFPILPQQIHSLLYNEIEDLILDSRNSRLIKMKLRLIIDIEQIIFFIRLIRYVEYLEIECSNDIDLELLVQCILLKTDNCITSKLCSICLCVGEINDEIMEKLHQIMARKDLFHEYTINRVCDRIYLQWKLLLE